MIIIKCLLHLWKNTYNQCVIIVHCMTILQSYLQGYLRVKDTIKCLNCSIQKAEASEPLWNQDQPGVIVSSEPRQLQNEALSQASKSKQIMLLLCTSVARIPDIKYDWSLDYAGRCHVCSHFDSLQSAFACWFLCSVLQCEIQLRLMSAEITETKGKQPSSVYV